MNQDSYKIVDTRVILDHPMVKVIRETLEFGGRKRPYFYIESPVEAVATVGLANPDLLVLTRQYRHPVRQVIYDLPAGRLNPGELPLDGARREFEEETGLLPSHIEPLGYYNQFPGTLRAGTHLFFATNLTPTRQHLDPLEDLEIEYKTVGDVLSMILGGELIDGSLQFGVLLALQKGLLPSP